MAIIWRISLDRHVKNCENVALEIYEKVKQSAHLHFAVVYSEQGNMLTNRVQHMFLAGSMFVRKPQKVQTITGRANAEGVQRREVQSFFHPEFSAYVYLVKTEDMCPRDRRYISYSSTSYRLSLTSSLLLCACQWSAPQENLLLGGGWINVRESGGGHAAGKRVPCLSAGRWRGRDGPGRGAGRRRRWGVGYPVHIILIFTQCHGRR